MELKQYTLSSPLMIYDGTKKIATIYDAISAIIFSKYFTSWKLTVKHGSKKLDNYNQLKLIYGDIQSLVDIARGFADTDFFIKSKGDKNFVAIPDESYLESFGEIMRNIADFTGELLAKYVGSQDQLNQELEDILQYGLFDDEGFSRLANYYSGMIFNETIDEGQKSSVQYGDYLLQTSLDEAADIPDHLINYVEREVLGFEIDTANLRRLIGFEPQGWQRYFLINQKRFSTIVGSRKLGKSYLMAYLLIRQIFKKNQDIVYVVPNFDMADQVWSYIERFIRDINDPGLRFDKARRTFSYTTNRSICTFVSADSKSMGRSKKADLVLYDEGSFVSDLARKTLIPLVANTMGYEVYVSTVSIETPINWFYKNFKKGELGLDAAYFSVRVDIYHNPFIADDEKKRLIQEYKDDPMMSATELFAMFPSVGGGFNLGEFFLHHTNTTDIIVNGVKIILKGEIEDLKKEYYRFALGYDPALMRDKGGLVIIGVKRIVDTIDGIPIDKNKFEIIGGAYINVTDYTQQINIMLELQELLKQVNSAGQIIPCFVAMDATGSGMGVYELMRGMGVQEIHRIFWGGSNFIEPTYDNGIWKANKKDLESLFRAGAGRDLFAYNYNTELRSEIEEYGVSTRSAGDGHFDQLSAGFCAYFICKRYIGDWVGDTRNLPGNPEDMFHHIEDLAGKKMHMPGSISIEEGQVTRTKTQNQRYRRFTY